jgi:hypothetical protein
MPSSIPTIDAHACCPDPSRSSTGAWLLPGNLLPRVDELKAQDPSRSTPQCFEMLDATWDENYYEQDTTSMTFYFHDPVKTAVTRVSDGTEYRGAWAMTNQQKAQADAVRAANPDWEWSKCCEAVGARWDAGCEFTSCSVRAVLIYDSL